MGTRADFYVGTGKEAEWLGSVAWDGYEWAENEDSPIMTGKTEEEFRQQVSKLLAQRDDATLPEHGWPWPWNDSGTTDYAYAFEDGKTTPYTKDPPKGWPNMKDKKNVTFGARSGLIVVGG